MKTTLDAYSNCRTSRSEWFRLAVYFLILLFCSTVSAQTSSFTYQGKLNDGGIPANGSYDMQFKLFDAVTGTGQVGSTITWTSIQASGGIFTAELDFGPAAFSGADRFLEISISPAGQGNFTILSPRQKLGSSPYSIKSINSTTADNSLSLGGTAASEFVQTSDSRMTDARQPLPGSSDYIQNGTTSQAGINFNVGGTGTASVLNATAQFNLNGNRILTGTTRNLFIGLNAGTNNGIGSENSFVGADAGRNNTSGTSNSFFGTGAGRSNTSGNFNSFFGTDAGVLNSTGLSNAFFGGESGLNNSFGSQNSFFGFRAGRPNTTGNSNAFFGANTGQFNTIGENNVFVGANSGPSNTAGSRNIFLGQNAGVFNSIGSDNIFIGKDTGVPGFNSQVNNSMAIGNGSVVSQSNTIVLGGSSHKTLLAGRLRIGAPSGVSGELPGSGYVETFRVTDIFQGIYTPNVIFGSFTSNPRNAVQACVLFQGIPGQTAGVVLTNCTSAFSSISDKTEVQPFTGGLEIIKRLTPVAFRHKENGSPAIGLNTEDVAEIVPSLIQRDEKLSVEQVNESSLNVLFINAFKEQQRQIETQEKKLLAQEEQILRQHEQIDMLKKLICQSNQQAEVCKEGQR